MRAVPLLVALLVAASAGSAPGAQERGSLESAVERAVHGDARQRAAALEALRSEAGGKAVDLFLRYVRRGATLEERANAVYGMRRLGPDAVVALGMASHEGDSMARQNVAMALEAYSDARAVAELARLAESDPDPLVRERAEEAMRVLGGAGPARERLLEVAQAYRRGDLSAGSTLFGWDGRHVTAVEAPSSVVSAALALHSARDAAALSPGDDAVFGELLESIGALLAATEADGGPFEGQTVALKQALALGGRLAPMAVEVAEADIEPLAGAEDLLASADKRLRYRAALTLAASGTVRSDVVEVLADALSESATRLALVVASDPEERNFLVTQVESPEVSVVSAETGARGLLRAKAAPAEDLCIVRHPLPDLSTEQFVRSLRRDPRTAGMSVIVVADESRVGALADALGEEVISVVPAPAAKPVLEPAMQTALERAALNDERIEAERFAVAAARQLARLDGSALAPAAEALVAALGRADEIRVPSLVALAKFGPSEAQRPVLEIWTSADASKEARLAAALALAGILARHEALPETLSALRAGLDAEDADLALAAAGALGAAASLETSERTRLVMQRLSAVGT